MASRATTESGTDVVIVYTKYDERLCTELRRHLTVLVRQNLISSIRELPIEVRADRTRNNELPLDEAHVILLLVSAHFLSSDYCWGLEFSRALQRHDAGDAILIPIILSPVYLGDVPFATLPTLPENAKPITTWENVDEALVSVVKELRTAVSSSSVRTPGGFRSQTLASTDSTTWQTYVDIKLFQADALALQSDILVLKYAQNFYGLDRMVSQILAARGEVDLDSFRLLPGFFRIFDTFGRIEPTGVLFVGVEPLDYFNYEAIENFAALAVSALRHRAKICHVCITLHGAGYGLDEIEALRTLVRGLVRSIAAKDCPLELETVTIAEADPKRFSRLAECFNALQGKDLEGFTEHPEQNVIRVLRMIKSFQSRRELREPSVSVRRKGGDSLCEAKVG